MQNISLLNQFFTGLSDQRSARSTPDTERATVPSLDKPRSQGVTVELSYNKAEFSYSASAGGRSFSVSLIETKLGAQVQNFASSTDSSSILEAKFSQSKLTQSSLSDTSVTDAFRSSNTLSPEAVAEVVLGFVERRIESAVNAGADDEQLNKLFAEGLAGVNQGYGEAIEQIEQQGLMTDELAVQIDAGYGLIESGFEDLRETYLAADTTAVSEPPLAVDPAFPAPESEQQSSPPADSVVNTPAPVVAPTTSDSTNTNTNSSRRDEAPATRAETPASQVDRDERPQRSRLAEALSANRSQLAAEDVGISITTQDGDQIRIRASELTGQSQSFGYAANGGFQSLPASSNAFNFSGFDLQIDGDLDDGELKALESLLLQVEDIAASFFNGDLDQAFTAATELDVDMSEIASYAVSMTSLRYQAVEAAYQPQQSPSQADVFKPLTDLLPSFTSALAEAEEFSRPKQLLNDLISRALEPIDQLQQTNQDRFRQFSNSLIDQLLV